MDVELLSRMVGELIVDHDQVGLPGVGTFVAEVTPATFSDKGYTINPPYRRLSFHPSRLEDTLLVDFYAKSNGIDRDAAKAYIIQFLAELKAVLKDRKTIVFPGLGRLRATKENNFFFVADEDLDIFPEGFGLKTVSLKTHPDLQREEVEINVSTPIVESPAEAADSSPEVVAGANPVEAIAENPEVPAEASPVEAAVAEAPVEASPEIAADANTVEASPEIAAEVNPAEAVEPNSEMPAEVTPEEAVEASPVAVAETEAAPAVEAPVAAAVPAEMPAEVNPEKIPAEAKPVEANAGRKGRKRLHWLVVLLIVLASTAVVLLLVFFVLAQAAPDFIDSILYTPEELRIINY